jgi:hypothetical protein
MAAAAVGQDWGASMCATRVKSYFSWFIVGSVLGDFCYAWCWGWVFGDVRIEVILCLISELAYVATEVKCFQLAGSVLVEFDRHVSFPFIFEAFIDVIKLFEKSFLGKKL